MLTTPTLDRLPVCVRTRTGRKELKLDGMAKVFEERLGIMVERESIERENRRLKSKLKKAKLRLKGCMEDIDYRHPRGLDKSLMKSLSSCNWIRENLNVIITGATGTGKSYIACALGHRACLNGYKVLYFRAPRLFQELGVAKGDGRYVKLINTIAKSHMIIIDDWGLSTLNDQEQRDFLEILDDKHGIHSTIIAGQLPIEHWHEAIGNPTLADAILDRLVHNAYKITLKGESMRKKRSTLT